MSRLQFAPSSDEIKVDLETGRLEFTTRAGKTFDAQALRKAIEDAGYGVQQMTVDGKPVQPAEEEAKPAEKGRTSQ